MISHGEYDSQAWVQESVANSLEGMSLYEDALQQYYELEATFFQVLQEKNLSWFGALITPIPTDDSAPLLSVTKKPYRDFILANTISVFDFRVYLLARECALLSKVGDMEELCRKASSFLSTFGRTLREVEVRLSLRVSTRTRVDIGNCRTPSLLSSSSLGSTPLRSA